jgi:hypothetical protein
MSTTVVTCYYRIPSKHSHIEYDRWLTDFISNIHCNLVIFTSHDLVEYLYEKRGASSHLLKERTKIIPIELEDIELAKKYNWSKQYQLDKQTHTGRSKECYILWNSKLWFLKKAIEENPFLSDTFIWNDIGCLRTHNKLIIQYLSNRYPIYEKISKDAIDIVLLRPFQNMNQHIFIDEVHFSGAQFGGHKEVLLRFYDLFYKRLDEHINKGVFVGCDQQTISSVYTENPQLFNCIIPNKSWIDPWFFIWQYYS